MNDKLEQVEKEIWEYDKKIITLVEKVGCIYIDWYQINNDVENLKTKKHLIEYEMSRDM